MSIGRGNVISTKTWTPAVLAKRPDNIISSDYARASRVFTPSYERDCRPCMEQLMANEYQRIWWQERQAWGKNLQGKIKEKKFNVKIEGSSHNVTLAKSTSKNLSAPQTKVSKEDVSAKIGAKKLQSSNKRKTKR